MEIAGYIAAVGIGILLGMLGGGGSILTVPVLVYLMLVKPADATTYSLFIVGITSLVGGIKAYSKKMVDFRAVTEFGIPSILSIFITRHYLLPAIPENLFSLGSIPITKDIFLMVVFAILMLSASFLMIRNDNSEEEAAGKIKSSPSLPLIFLGLAIGVVTGLLGAGGGFLIIPILVIFMNLPMKTAVGTSLMIIAINSLFGFLFSLKQSELNWLMMLIFTALATIGIFIGGKLADKVPGPTLKKGFGWFILLMGLYIIVKELFLGR